ncbi:MAG: hypothetical protein RL648_1009 [Verrucomicrobiota bacterium]|jgi:hypothetical protein
MSNPPSSTSEPSDKKVLFSALGWLGVIFVFLLILAVAYLPNRAVSIEEANVAERMTIRNTVRGEQARLVSTYEWVDREKGVVRIPVERAMKLTVDELRGEAAGGESR